MKSLTGNNLGEHFLVEECQRVAMKPFLRRHKANLKDLVLRSEIALLDSRIALTISQTGNGGNRYWFVCPLCQQKMGVLFQHPLDERIGCRVCLNLEYRCRRYKGMIESRQGSDPQ